MADLYFEQPREALKALLASPKNIVITTHHKPDADALGSSLALSAMLLAMGHEVKVITPSDYPGFLEWMPGEKNVLAWPLNLHNPELETLIKNQISGAELIFCLDFSALSRLQAISQWVGEAKATKIMIDHHLEPENFADFSLWNTQSAATCQLIYEFAVLMGYLDLVDKKVANCLYAGIMTDTGSFRFGSTSAALHRIVADLIDLGAENTRIHNLIYDDNTESRLRFIGYALLDKLVVLPEFRTAYFAISKQELEDYQSRTGDTEGLVNYALSITGIVVGALFIERGDRVKISFRSLASFSVNDLARANFGGGGHKNAAGGYSFEPLEQTVTRFVGLLPSYAAEIEQAFGATASDFEY